MGHHPESFPDVEDIHRGDLIDASPQRDQAQSGSTAPPDLSGSTLPLSTQTIPNVALPTIQVSSPTTDIPMTSPSAPPQLDTVPSQLPRVSVAPRLPSTGRRSPSPRIFSLPPYLQDDVLDYLLTPDEDNAPSPGQIGRRIVSAGSPSGFVTGASTPNPSTPLPSPEALWGPTYEKDSLPSSPISFDVGSAESHHYSADDSLECHSGTSTPDSLESVEIIDTNPTDIHPESFLRSGSRTPLNPSQRTTPLARPNVLGLFEAADNSFTESLLKAFPESLTRGEDTFAGSALGLSLTPNNGRSTAASPLRLTGPEPFPELAEAPPGARPIPALHGPPSLPYARCPSGAEGEVFYNKGAVADLVWNAPGDEQDGEKTVFHPDYQAVMDYSVKNVDIDHPNVVVLVDSELSSPHRKTKHKSKSTLKSPAKISGRSFNKPTTKRPREESPVINSSGTSESRHRKHHNTDANGMGPPIMQHNHIDAAFLQIRDLPVPQTTIQHQTRELPLGGAFEIGTPDIPWTDHHKNDATFDAQVQLQQYLIAKQKHRLYLEEQQLRQRLIEEFGALSLRTPLMPDETPSIVDDTSPSTFSVHQLPDFHSPRTPADGHPFLGFVAHGHDPTWTPAGLSSASALHSPVYERLTGRYVASSAASRQPMHLLSPHLPAIPQHYADDLPSSGSVDPWRHPVDLRNHRGLSNADTADDPFKVRPPPRTRRAQIIEEFRPHEQAARQVASIIRPCLEAEGLESPSLGDFPFLGASPRNVNASTRLEPQVLGAWQRGHPQIHDTNLPRPLNPSFQLKSQPRNEEVHNGLVAGGWLAGPGLADEAYVNPWTTPLKTANAKSFAEEYSRSSRTNRRKGQSPSKPVLDIRSLSVTNNEARRGPAKSRRDVSTVRSPNPQIKPLPVKDIQQVPVPAPKAIPQSARSRKQRNRNGAAKTTSNGAMTPNNGNSSTAVATNLPLVDHPSGIIPSGELGGLKSDASKPSTGLPTTSKRNHKRSQKKQQKSKIPSSS